MIGYQKTGSTSTSSAVDDFLVLDMGFYIGFHEDYHGLSERNENVLIVPSDTEPHNSKYRTIKLSAAVAPPCLMYESSAKSIKNLRTVNVLSFLPRPLLLTSLVDFVRL